MVDPHCRRRSSPAESDRRRSLLVHATKPSVLLGHRLQQAPTLFPHSSCTPANMLPEFADISTRCQLARLIALEAAVLGALYLISRNFQPVPRQTAHSIPDAMHPVKELEPPSRSSSDTTMVLAAPTATASCADSALPKPALLCGRYLFACRHL